MALFTDGPLNGLMDLQNYENRILEVAAAEGIDLAGKGALAQDEIANELTMFLLRRLPFAEPPWLTGPTRRQQLGVSDVVVTAPLRQWHAHKTLAAVYRDAYNNQLNDRYRGKWDEYDRLAKMSAQQYFQIGAGLVGTPIAMPSAPVVDTITGSGLPGSYYVAVTWSGDGGQESSSSETAQISITAGQQLRVSAGSPPKNARGWNVYIGESPKVMRRQNSDPIGIGNAWTLTGPLSDGPSASDGQPPSWYVVDQRVIERG